MEKKQSLKPSEKELEVAQSSVRRLVVIFMSLAVMFASMVYKWIPTSRLPLPLGTVAARLVFTIQWNILSVAVIAIIIVVIGNTRYHSNQMNPFSAVDYEKVEVHVRVLQNTVEQFVISFAAQLAMSTWLDKSQMMIIPIVVVLFVVGRILYWIGYLNPAHGHSGRACGFPLTMFPTILMTGFCIYKLVITTF